jgi:hypothetical protein
MPGIVANGTVDLLNPTFDPNLIAVRQQPPLILTPLKLPLVVTDAVGEKWDISAPDDIKIVATNDASNNLHLTFNFDYSVASLYGTTAHGIDTVTFTPEKNSIADVTGFKATIDINVTNGLPVNTDGFFAFLVDNQPVVPPDVLDKTTFHPTNYAHIHNLPPTGFAPLTVTVATPDFQQVPNPPPAGVQPIAISNITGTGIMTPGETVSAAGMTLHQEELLNHDNGFTLNFFPLADPNPARPVISGLPSSEIAAIPAGNPFATTTVTDTSILPVEIATITVKDAAGNATDADGLLSGFTLTKTGVGTYHTGALLPADINAALQGLVFTPAAPAGATGSFTLSVDNGGFSPVTATESFTIAPTSAVITTDGPSLPLDGNNWTINQGQVAVNGAIDPTTARVVAIELDKGRIYQENADKQWWSKSLPTDPWTPGAPPDSSPDPLLAVSANNTVLTETAGNSVQTIVDAGNNTWSIHGGQVSINGTIDQTTANVVKLAYENGQVWQENTNNLWWAKSSPTDTWLPAPGTPVSPVTEPGLMSTTAAMVGPDTVGMALKAPPLAFINNSGATTVSSGGNGLSMNDDLLTLSGSASLPPVPTGDDFGYSNMLETPSYYGMMLPPTGALEMMLPVH